MLKKITSIVIIYVIQINILCSQSIFQKGDYVDDSFLVTASDIAELSKQLSNKVALIDSDSKIHYSIFLSDRTKIETTDINRIVDLKNSRIRRITSVTISFIGRSQNSNHNNSVYWSFDLSIGGGYRYTVPITNSVISYTVKGGDIDWVYNVERSITEYIDIMKLRSPYVGRYRGIVRVVGGFILFFISLASLLEILARTRRYKKYLGGSEHSSTLFQKFLDDEFGTISVFAWTMVIALVCGFVIYKIYNWMYPSIWFLINEGISDYEYRKTVRNIVWVGIVIAIIVNVASSYIKEWIDLPKRVE